MNNAQTMRAFREAKAGGSHTRAEWMKVIADQNFMCRWCGCSLRDSNGKLRATRDHLTPLVRGGSHSISNIAAACQACNSSKGWRTAEEFTAFLQAKGIRIPTLCTLPASKKEVLFARDLSPEMREFTAPLLASKKFPARPDHYWTERRAFLKWQLRTLAKNEASALVFKGLEVKQA
jgi:HNH endonuclease